MADIGNDIKLISKRNEGFPDWLDFEKLRKEGIEYIAQLSGKIWTDHNIHDPGITILEMLCFKLPFVCLFFAIYVRFWNKYVLLNQKLNSALNRIPCLSERSMVEW